MESLARAAGAIRITQLLSEILAKTEGEGGQNFGFLLTPVFCQAGPLMTEFSRDSVVGVSLTGEGDEWMG